MADQGEQVKFQVHHIRFFEYQPQTINCIAYDEVTHRIALSRADATVEILNTKENWYQEMVFPGNKDASVETLLWCQGRLFAGGISGNVVELDLVKKLVKSPTTLNNISMMFLGRILSIAWYNQDGVNIVITGGINNIRQWSVKSGQPISRMTLGRKFQKDTIVWCLAMTNDYHFIEMSAWSLAAVTSVHAADVMNKDETKVYTGGVDSTLFQFTLHAADPISERKRWVHQRLHSRHTHDIRALAYANDSVVSGGVDTLMWVTKVKGKQTVSEVAPLPPPGVCHVAKTKNLVQLQYQNYIEVWRLGAAKAPSAETRGMLPLIEKRIRLVRLDARDGHEILCSTMSSNGVIAFSDVRGVRVFDLLISETPTSVTLKKVKCTFAHPAHHLMFTSDGSHLVAVLITGSIQVVKVSTGEIHAFNRASESLIHRLTISPDDQHLAVATINHEVHIYSMKNYQHICSCPVQSSQVSALTFSPHSCVLVLAYCNHSIYEFDVVKKNYTQWSRENSESFGKNWLKPLCYIQNIAFSPGDPQKIIFHTSNALCVLDKTKPLLNVTLETKKTDKTLAVRCSYKYKYLLFADTTSDGMLVIVERPPSEIEDNLLPSFKQKKFGIS
uniref:Anaphase-promoting complex subunit 4-like WD40 domain-containing protein n=1 Tax=Biomphalaria glabrata TaxID=6526 RepID=A0A2C9L9X7_BIOGL